MKRRGERGAVLLQTVVFIVLMGMMYALWLRLTMGRYVWGARAVKSERNLHRIAGVEAVVHACLHDGEVGRLHCRPGGREWACFPTNYDGKKVAVEVDGFAPNCRLRIILSD